MFCKARAKRAADADAASRLRLAHDALDIQRARYSAKLMASNTRASFLIAGSGIVLRFNDGEGEFRALPVVLLLLAAALAAFAIRPGRVKEIDVEELRVGTRGKTVMVAEWAIYRAKLASLNSSRQLLQPREKALLVSTGLFLSAALLIGIESTSGSDSAPVGSETSLIPASPSATIRP